MLFDTKRGRMIAFGMLAASAIAAGVFTSVSAHSAPHAIAGPSTCAISQTGTSSRLVCSPGVSPGVSGAPSEQDITAKNAYRARLGGIL